MAKKEILLQGFTSRTHSLAAQKLFDISDLQRVIFSVAFVTRGGVSQLETVLKKNAARTVIYAGIRNELTSKQGLELLLQLGVRVFSVDTGLRRRIYHPKIFYVGGKSEARILVGSANLTLGGLSNNIEASVAINLDLAAPEDADFAGSVEKLLGSLEKEYPKNITAIKSATELQALLDAGLIVDEDLLLPPKTRPPRGKSGSTAETPPIVLKTKYVIPQRSHPKKPPTSKVPTAAPTASAGEAASGVRSYVLVWQSRPLRPSNISLFTSDTAREKNVLSLGQGGYARKIDFQHYFRNEVFDQLDWGPSDKPGVDEALADFEAVIANVNQGPFQLRVKYSQSTATVKQSNVTTRLVWGKLLQLVRTESNLGRVVYIYRDIDDPKRFLIEID